MPISSNSYCIAEAGTLEVFEEASSKDVRAVSLNASRVPVVWRRLKHRLFVFLILMTANLE
jgi:hypothetical protein